MGSSAIHTIRWDFVPSEYVPCWVDSRSNLTAIWPAPVDSDACFRAAGFTDFDDSDEKWDAEFEAIIERSVCWLKRYGEPVIRKRIEFWRPWFKRLFSRSPEIPVVRQLLAPTINDNFPDCVVEFGQPPAVTVRTRLGHPVLWLTWRKELQLDVEGLVAFLAENRDISRTTLDWRSLIGPHADGASEE